SAKTLAKCLAKHPLSDHSGKSRGGQRLHKNALVTAVDAISQKLNDVAAHGFKAKPNKSLDRIR
ncbi:MAG: hypothetical protein KA392_14020, partial [Candidatus Obscuribacter sp.]|nr:hypothetical protein [Candidatus Obscuribacter sp.]